MNLQEIENYVLYAGDNALILGHRLSEWCGHGPILEQDIALTNIALDLIGLARNCYQYAASHNGHVEEDYYPYHRMGRAFQNVLLVEQPNGDFAQTLVRQFLFDAYHVHYLQALGESTDNQLRAIANKSIKEARYHLEFSSEWMKRMGDGTEESHQRVQSALNRLFPFTHELFVMTDLESKAALAGIGPDLNTIKKDVENTWQDVFQEATLEIPQLEYGQKGGKNGIHSEHLGKLLAEMQYLQRAYPGASW